MRAKLIVEGKEFDIDIFDPELHKLVRPEKKTGYERVNDGETYFYPSLNSKFVNSDEECLSFSGNGLYESANYYSSKTVAENNARADKLMRQLRRFAVEQRECVIDWNVESLKYTIRYGHATKELKIDQECKGHDFGIIVFDSEKAAKLAIETFHDELIWYFTEYKDSL